MLAKNKDNPPDYVSLDGNKEWLDKGKRHRIGGPAIERTNGRNDWYFKGFLHNTEGPAWEWANGDGFYYLWSLRILSSSSILLVI